MWVVLCAAFVLVEFANRYFTREYRCAGVHLVFLDHSGQSAATYWYDPSQSWMRKYSLVLPTEEGTPLEAVLTICTANSVCVTSSLEIASGPWP